MFSLKDLTEKFLRWVKLHRAERTEEYYRAQLEKAVQLIGDIQADELTPLHLTELPRSWHVVQALQRLYAWACREAKLLKKNPLRRTVKPRLGRRHRLLTRAELVCLLRAAAAPFRRFLFCMIESSARPQEVRGLRWEFLRWPPEARTVAEALRSGLAWFELCDYKARDLRADSTTPRVIPVSPRLGRLLTRLLRGRPAAVGPVFLNRRHKEWNKNTVVCAMRRLRKATGLALPPRTGGEQICCYSLRHTRATQLAERGMPTHHLQTLLGHASIETTMKYVHLQNAAALAAWQKWCAEQRGKDGGKSA